MRSFGSLGDPSYRSELSKLDHLQRSSTTELD